MFEKEIKLFKEIKADLIAKNPSGGYVVINGDKVLGVWTSREDALKEGIEEYGNVPFLVKNINEDQYSVNFSRNISFA